MAMKCGQYSGRVAFNARYPAGNITGWRLWLDEPLQSRTTSASSRCKALSGRTGANVSERVVRGCAHGKEHDKDCC